MKSNLPVTVLQGVFSICTLTGHPLYCLPLNIHLWLTGILRLGRSENMGQTPSRLFKSNQSIRLRAPLVLLRQEHFSIMYL